MSCAPGLFLALQILVLGFTVVAGVIGEVRDRSSATVEQARFRAITEALRAGALAEPDDLARLAGEIEDILHGGRRA